MALKRLLCLFVILTLTVLSFASCEVVGKIADKLPFDLPFGDSGDDEPEVILQSIEIISGSVATTVEQGKALDTAGLKVLATYSDNTTKEIGAADLTIGRIDTGVVGTHTLEVSYGGLTKAIEITVTKGAEKPAEPTVKKIEYVDGSLVTSFNVGYEFSADALKILVTYSDGSTKEVGISDGLQLGEFNPAIGGTQYLTVSYGGKMTSIEFNITALLTGIEFDTESMSTEFAHLSETVDVSALKVFALYNDGTKVSVAYGNSKLTVNSDEISTADITTDATFSVTYTESETVSYTINVPYTVVKAVVGITVVDGSIATSLPVGAKLDISSLAVNVLYTDGSEEVVVTGITTDTISTDLVGTEVLTVSYSGFEATVSVEVVKALIGISYVSGAPESFKHNEILGSDKDDMSDYVIVISARYDYGNEIKTEEIELNAENAADYTLTADLVTDTVGEFEIAISYLGFNTTTTYSVVKVLESITVDTTNYVDTFHHKSDETPDGLAIVALFSDETTEIYTNGFVINGFSTENTGTYTFSVNFSNEYGNASATVEYTIVKDIESIVIDESSVTKFVYFGGEYDYSTITFTLVYTDGSTDLEMYPLDEEITTKISTSAVGTQKIVVTYEGLTDETEVEVIAKLTSIEYVGDAIVLDHNSVPTLAGVFTATYSDGTVKNVTVTPEISTATVGEFTFTATYTEENAIESVTVTSAPIAYTVNKVFVSITFNDGSCKTVYNPFETVDLTGAKATVLYSDGSTTDGVDIVIGEYTFSTDTTLGGTATVPFTYGDYSGSFEIKVYRVTSLAILGYTVTEIDYLYAEDLDALLAYSTMTVKVVLESGEEIIVAGDDITFSNTINVNSVGEYTVKATTNYGAATYTVSVLPAVVSIEYVEGSVSTEYFQGREPNLDTIKFIVTYNDGSTVTVGYTDVVITGLDVTSGSEDGVVGEFTATYTFRGVAVTDTVAYTVFTAVEEAIIKIADDKKNISFAYGTEFALEDILVGGTFTIKYEGMDATDVTDNVTIISSYDPENPSIGTFTITVSYRGFTDTATISVYYEIPEEEAPEIKDDFEDSGFKPIEF